MKILYGTTNIAKLTAMKRVTEPLGIELIGLNDLNQPIPPVNENGKNPLENAKIKAKIYYQAFNIPVFSCDSGLYFDNLPDNLQPGTHIRRINGKELNDEELIEYYSSLASTHGNLIGRYRNAIHFIINDETNFSSIDESLGSEPFMIVSKPHPDRIVGFPLDTLSIDLETGKYYFDLDEKSIGKLDIYRGFEKFFIQCLIDIK